MFWENKVLFDNEFFDSVLNQKAGKEFIVRFITTDSRDISDPELTCFIAIKGEFFDGHNFFHDAYVQGVRVFILEETLKDIPHDAVIYYVENTVEALGKLAHHHKKQLMIPHVLITGSIGKTTTRLMLHHMMKQKYNVHTAQKNWNNHIGLPMTILQTPASAQVSVLEAGMSHKGEISYLSQIVQPNIAVITNISHSHIGNFSSIDDVAEAKIEIVDGMQEHSYLLINKHDPYRKLFESRAKGKIVYFDPQLFSVVEDQGLDGFTFTYKYFENEIFHCPIPGTHLFLNLAIFFTMAEIFQISVLCIHRGLSQINQGLGNRIRIIHLKKPKITIIADCYNASLESFKAALEVLKKGKGRRIAVIGDILELGKQSVMMHRALGEYIRDQFSADLVFAVGKDIKYTCEIFEGEIPYIRFEHRDDVWQPLQDSLQEGDVVLVKASNGIGFDVIVQALEGLEDALM